MQHRTENSPRRPWFLIALASGAALTALLLASPNADAQPDESFDDVVARMTDDGYRVTVETFGNCAPQDGTVVGTRVGPRVWADTSTDTKAGGGGGDGQPGSRGGVAWTRSVAYKIAYVTVNCHPGGGAR